MNTASQFFKHGSFYIMKKGNVVHLFDASILVGTVFQLNNGISIGYCPMVNDRQKIILKPYCIYFEDYMLTIKDMNELASLCPSKPMLQIIKVGCGILFNTTKDFIGVCGALKDIKPSKLFQVDRLCRKQDLTNMIGLYKACEYILTNPVIETESSIESFMEDGTYEFSYLPMDNNEPIRMF